MKMIRSLFFTIVLAICCAATSYSQDVKTVKARLQEATVYFSGAQLTHSASCLLSKGENQIVIEGLSPILDVNSLKIKASNGVLVSSSEYSTQFAKDNTSDAKTKKLQDSLTFYSVQLSEINTEIAILNKTIDLLQKGTEKSVSGSTQGLSSAELLAAMNNYGEKMRNLQAQLNKSAETQKKLTETIARLQQQINEETLKNAKNTGVLKLTLSAPVAGETVFSVTYISAAARWVPFYDIVITSVDKPVRIAAQSKVSQTTGMDWEKIKLTLSTSTPSNGKTAPLFNAWFLDFEKDMVVVAYGQQRKTMQNAFSYDLAEAAPMQLQMSDEVLAEKEATMDDYIVANENELNLTYNIDLPYTIPGNGREQRIDLQTKETEAEYKYYCAPKLDTETYLLAEISDWEKLNLLSGQAQITYDGNYIGKTFINTQQTNTKLTLTLGTDKRVSVKREKMQDFSSSKFLGNDVKQEFTYRIVVRFNRNNAVKMVLKDQYPLSTQKNIEVELLTKNTTPWTANVEELGVITWEEELKAGETREYRISYSVKYPKGSKVGL